MALRRPVLHQDRVEVGGRRQGDRRGSIAKLNRAGLLGVRAVFLIGLDRDSVRTERHGFVLVVQAVPYQVVPSSGPRGASDRSKRLDVSSNAGPQGRQVRVVFLSLIHISEPT